jgi:formylglycine-generating enzyme required for sulfatase activity
LRDSVLKGRPVRWKNFAVALAVAAVFVASEGRALEIQWVHVAEAGNPPDVLTHCYATECGAVAYGYYISQTEVTNAMYAEFLNAVDPNGLDALALYNVAMGTDYYNGGILRFPANAAGARYVVRAGFEDKPVVFVSFHDTLRFANWLHNGAGDASTEVGAYTITEAGIAANSITREPDAVAFLPSENEWYKAAFHQGGSLYSGYPTASDVAPVCSPPTFEPNHANCDNAVGAVTEVGSYPGSISHHGTVDQAGNVWEWNEQIVAGGLRGRRGGPWLHPTVYMQASNRNVREVAYESYSTGFRVATLAPACSNSTDDDRDGHVDFPEDPGCADATGATERSQCQNGLDDDFDGGVDYDGGQSIHGACDGGVCPPGVSDPDADGVADPDPRCVGAPARRSESASNPSCGLGAEVALLLSLLRRLQRRRLAS